MPEDLCCHSCRATGITAFLEGGSDVETAQYVAGHADPRTTKALRPPSTAHSGRNRTD
ncbi:MAG: hypothetical protein JXO72_02885 [Vicinamibacteria bacterium]|nr:hypothetical protein [Vicinamibacteria bacterium]